MEKFGKSQSVKRVEDVRFLTGGGGYVDDITPAGALHAFVLRSPVAHAVLTELNVADAAAAEGVHLVATADWLIGQGVSMAMQATVLENRDGTRAAGPDRPLLARGKLRFVGEAIAMIFAETLEQARDAAELIEYDYDELPAQMALSAGETAVHTEAPDNRAFDWGMGDEDATEAALAASAHHLTFDIDDNRIIVNSMEPRGCFAEMDGARLHLAVNGQGVWAQKDQLFKMLSMPADDIRVTNPDVGGGFGMKAMTYPEYFICSAAARALNMPVRWMSDRSEAMQSDNGGRDLVSTVEIGFDADLKMTAYKVHSRCNLGAYNSQFGQPIQTMLFSKVLTGVYDVQTSYLHVEGYFTNTAQVDAYRGAGRPEAIYVLERSMDYAAVALGVDGWDLRQRNFIPAAAFPYVSATGEIYDVGDFDRLLKIAALKSDRAGFEARRAASVAKGKLRGLGLCYYIESILGDPSEAAKVEFNDDGSVTIYVGTQSNGQGHETVYAQFLSDQTGIPADLISVVQGDSDRIAKGGGTGGSRSVTVQNNATLATVDRMLALFTPFLATMVKAEEDAIMFDEDRFRVKGSNETFSLLDAAALARANGRSDLLTHEARAELPARSYPNGAHVAEVEIDPDTGTTKVERYTVVDDFGNLINPMLAAGQVHGGVAQ